MIIYTNLQTNNVCSCTLMSSVPEGITGYEVEPPQDRQYRDAWIINAGKLNYDLDKAKLIAHDMRRVKRQVDFSPYDNIIALNIPTQDNERVAAEIARATIRVADTILQNSIDNVINIDELKAVI